MGKNKHTKKKELRQLRDYTEGDFGPDDGTYKPKKSKKFLRKASIKEDLEKEYIEDNDLL